MQTQTSNTLHNAIMEAGGKDRPPMLAPGNYVQWKSRIKRYIDTKPNHELIHYYLKNPSYKFTWTDKVVAVSEEAVQIILTEIDNDIYSIIDAFPNACEMWKAIERLKQVYHPQNHPNHYTQNSSTKTQQAATRNRGKVIINSLTPIYDQEPPMVAEDDEMSKDKEIDKLMALISLSFKKIYKPTNNNLQTSLNTIKANQDNSLSINRGTGYESQRIGNVVGAGETVEVTPDAADNSGPIFDAEPLQKVSSDDNYNVFAIESKHPEQSKSVHDTYSIEQDEHNMIIDSLDMSYDREQIDQNDDDDLANERELLASLIKKLKCEIDDSKNHNKSLETSNKFLVDKLKGEIEYFKTKNTSLESSNNHFKEANNKLEYYYADHMNAVLGVYTELDEDLKAQLHDKGIAISELKKLIEKLKGKSVDTKFEKSLVIRELNAFRSQRTSILGKPTIFSDSLERKDFSKSKSVTKNNVSNDFSKPVTAQILPLNKKSILKNTNVLASGIYKLHTETTQPRTTQLPHDLRKTNKRVSFSTRVIPITSVSRPKLKRNQTNDRVLLNNSQGKKQKVEDHRRNVKFSKNKTFVTACNDSLNAKTSNVIFVCATYEKCVLNEKHNMYVLKSHNGVNSRTKMPIAVSVSSREPKRIVNQSVAKPLRRTVAAESINQKLRNTTRKLYKHVTKTCSWWYHKFTPPGYKWKPKSQIGNVNPNLVEIILFIVNSGCSKHMTGNLKLLINFVKKFLGTVKFGNDQIAPILGYGDLIQGAVTIKRVYYVEGLNHNLFFVGQFCDANLEVAFRKSTCCICNLKGNDLLTVRTIRTDKGTEFLNKTLHAYFAAEGINHQTSVDRTPEPNDVVERQNRTLVEAARTMLSAAKVPLFFWAEAIATTSFTQNRSLVIPRHEKTPYHIINDRKPSVKFFYILARYATSSEMVKILIK
uniref:Integrase catalytic domain-containing protein n=1 Tax=Tanacetum cinerariifolium TaxID=118510 RepID=A0A6L2LKC8_TANCI|nr:hypothetical protein [Tanacetum cinerariifolium]